MDPFHYDGAPVQHVRVSIGGRLAGEVALAWNPDRVGSYEFALPLGVKPSWRVRVDLEPDQRAPVSRAADAFPELPRDQQVGVKLWYVAVIPPR
jgi:hypothetical protein